MYSLEHENNANRRNGINQERGLYLKICPVKLFITYLRMRPEQQSFIWYPSWILYISFVGKINLNEKPEPGIDLRQYYLFATRTMQDTS